MELCKNIFFNTDRLTENTEVKISYTGKFFQDDSEEVSMHLGFGNEWKNLQDIKMEKTDLGFQAVINLIESDSLSFCFQNNNGEWDNNEGQNYKFPIEKAQEEAEIEIEDVEEEEEEEIAEPEASVEENIEVKEEAAAAENFEPIDQSLALTSPRKLRKTYLLTKKIKLAIYRLLKYIPKLVSGNYTSAKKSDEE